jgi:DNA-binding NarL/FixJ family response regulator
LVVEDAAAVRARFAAMLAELAGVARVIEADGIEEAREALRSSAPDVVILDLHLQGRSGMALVPVVKRERPGALLIVVTSQPNERYRRQSVALGADHFFDKSGELDEMLRTVEETVRPTGDAPTSDA